MKRVLISIAAGALLTYTQAATAQDLAAGKKLYADNCQRCHGNKGQGGIGKKLVGDAATWEFDLFKRAVMTGVDDAGKPLKPVMPIFGKVGLTKPKGATPTDADLQSVQAYVKTL